MPRPIVARLRPGDEVLLGEFTGHDGGRVLRTFTWIVDDRSPRLDWVEPGSKEFKRTTTSYEAVDDRDDWVRSTDASSPLTVVSLVPVLPIAMALDLASYGVLLGTVLLWAPLIETPLAVPFLEFFGPIANAWPVLPGG